MPDDPALGKFRKTFGGTVGTFDEYPTPGYEGVTEIVSTLDLWKKWREGGPGEPRRQPRLPQGAPLRPRGRQLGPPPGAVALGAHRRRARSGCRCRRTPTRPSRATRARRWARCACVVPRFMRYSGEYPKRIEGLTTNNYDVTRWLLADVEWPVYEEVARELVAQMTDAVIDEAMHQMPPEWYAIDGAQMTKDLRQRRDGLVAYARKFYLHLADPVDVRGTDRADLATVEHLDDGSLRADARAAQRRRHGGRRLLPAPLPAEGDEGDPALPAGRRRPGGRERPEQGRHPRARARPAGGNDTRRRLAERRPRRAGLRRATRRAARPGHEGERPRVEEPGARGRPALARAAQLRALDGADVPGVVAAQPGVHGGRRLHAHAWGFHKYPWANMQSFTLLYSTGYNNVRATLPGRSGGSATRAWSARVGARFSGIENMNFFGFGNETPKIEDSKLYTDRDERVPVFPALRFQPSTRFELHVGAEAKVRQTKGGDSLVEQQQAVRHRARSARSRPARGVRVRLARAAASA